MWPAAWSSTNAPSGLSDSPSTHNQAMASYPVLTLEGTKLPSEALSPGQEVKSALSMKQRVCA